MKDHHQRSESRRNQDPSTGLIWIEREDQAKQGMARKGDMRNARASDNRIHLGPTPGSGDIQ